MALVCNGHELNLEWVPIKSCFVHKMPGTLWYSLVEMALQRSKEEKRRRERGQEGRKEREREGERKREGNIQVPSTAQGLAVSQV